MLWLTLPPLRMRVTPMLARAWPALLSTGMGVPRLLASSPQAPGISST